jgi:hypothetical protein
MHGQDRLAPAEPDDQMATLPGLEAATLPGQSSPELSGGHARLYATHVLRFQSARAHEFRPDNGPRTDRVGSGLQPHRAGGYAQGAIWAIA